jgi:ribosomal protein L11 methylase PrmA
MLKDAALLHLDLMLAALDEGFILKDSSAYNVQWHGAQPVFIDIPSFEVLEAGQPWVAYRQFCELFLYPLMLQAYKGIDFRPWLRGSLDGMSAGSLRPLLSHRDLMRPGVMMHVVAQNALQRRYSGKEQNVRGTLAQAGFDKTLIVRNVRNLRKIISRMKPGGSKTVWHDYARTHSYGEAEYEAKCAFVRDAAGFRRWRRVWDLGCNSGTFSRIAAEHADYVVAMDGDWMAIEHLYQEQKERPDRGSILPLVVNLSDPSPGQGWRGTERKSLPDRGRPDLTLCLALIHHVVISSNIPIADFIRWLAGLGTALVIEFVDRDDEMVEMLLRNKDDQYDDYRLDVFETLLWEHFDVRQNRPLKGGKRSIYFALPKS